jgi:hypothetical protein
LLLAEHEPNEQPTADSAKIAPSDMSDHASDEVTDVPLEQQRSDLHEYVTEHQQQQQQQQQPQFPPSADSQPPPPILACWHAIRKFLNALTVHAIVAATLAVFAISNLLVARNNFTPTCSDLATYCTVIGSVSGFLILPVWLHHRYDTKLDANFFRRTIIGRICSFVGSLLVIALVIGSCSAIAALAESACPYQPSVRQMAMADVAPILTAAVVAFLYVFLKYHFPVCNNRRHRCLLRVS